MSEVILNIDDHEAGRYVRTRTLREAGFEVIEAGTGEGALDLTRHARPDLVLLDINLPDISGIEVCRILRTDRETLRIPIIHISATHVTPRDEASSLEAGADIYLAEPVDPKELVSSVRTLLRLRAAEKELAASEERLRLATEGAGIGTWDLDLRSGEIVWDGGVKRILGLPMSEAAASWDLWQRCIHPQDQTRVQAALATARATKDLFNPIHRVRRADNGAERYVAPYAKVHSDDEGVPVRLIGILADVTAQNAAEREREALLEEAHAARRSAEDAARLKDEFLATLSHELRTPMNAMLGWLQLLRSGRLNDVQRERALETIERNAHLQTQLINDLLDVSRIVNGKMQLEARPVLLDTVIRSALDSVRLAAEAKRIQLSHTLAAELSPVLADADRLQQVFANLLSNAIKFTPAEGRVEVEAKQLDDHVEISVIDTGQGIAPEFLPYIFDRFRQADASVSRAHGGLGLGLAIVRNLVEMHGGSVRAKSEGLGRGATFTVELPVEAKRRVSESEGARGALQGEAGSLSGVRVLAVDDDLDELTMTAELLRIYGAQVEIANDAQEALAGCRAFKPHVVLLDIGMPDADGYELFERLCRQCAADGSHVPGAIALTGYAREEDSSRALAAGFVAHLSKPLDAPRLCSVIRSVANQTKRG